MQPEQERGTRSLLILLILVGLKAAKDRAKDGSNSFYPTSNESSAKKNNHKPCTCKGRKSVSVGSVWVLGEPWLELLADCFLLPLLLTTKLFRLAWNSSRGGNILFRGLGEMLFVAKFRRWKKKKH